MRLYHFTTENRLDQIMAEGLKPSRSGLLVQGKEVVWLTTAETPNWLLDPRKLTCRLQLFISNSDPNLTKYENWLNRRGLMTEGRCREWGAHKTSWIYFSAISASCVRKILMVRYQTDETTERLLEEANEQWRRSGCPEHYRGFGVKPDGWDARYGPQ